MSRFIEPKGWDDLPAEKKSRMVQDLASKGLLNVEIGDPDPAILDRLAKATSGTLEAFFCRHLIEHRGVEKVAQGAASKMHVEVLKKTFGPSVVEHVPAELRNKFAAEGTGLSR